MEESRLNQAIPMIMDLIEEMVLRRSLMLARRKRRSKAQQRTEDTNEKTE